MTDVTPTPGVGWAGQPCVDHPLVIEHRAKLRRDAEAARQAAERAAYAKKARQRDSKEWRLEQLRLAKREERKLRRFGPSGVSPSPGDSDADNWKRSSLFRETTAETFTAAAFGLDADGDYIDTAAE